MIDNELKQPILENYLDYREFLCDYYDWRKASGKFSYQVWAEELGISSKGYLRLLVAGKRPFKIELVEKFSQVLKFKKKQFDYLFNLVQFNQAKNLETRELYFSKLQRGQKLERKWVADTYEYLADEWCPRVHVLLAQEGIEKTVEAFSRNLGLSHKKIESIFDRLKKLGYAQERNGVWYAKDTICSVPDQVNDLAVQSFHKKSLEKAVESIDTNPEDRHYNATYFVVSEEELSQVRAEINEFSKQLLKKFGTKKIKENEKNKLYQININAIPMSGQLIHSEIKKECVEVSELHYGEQEISL